MIVPLSWVSDYVLLPREVDTLTDRLTSIGHMLDKRYRVGDEIIIDLELRGNRSDMFGLIGVARDIAAAFDTPLLMPPTSSLPPSDPLSSLVIVEAPELVERFLAFELSVTVKPSPQWLVKRLSYFGIPAVNNVVDITNYCMLETGAPMHAYDRGTLRENRLILRRAKPDETLTTLLGTQVKLTPEDLAICDAEIPHAISLIGGQESRVTASTKEILLEAAVYKQANVRRTARQLKIQTEAGSRHEKLLDPNQVDFALRRAFYLLQQYADAESIGPACDYYPCPAEPKQITLPRSDILRLTGISVPDEEVIETLTRLECVPSISDHVLQVTVPTFRTDIEQPADIVEEIIRIYGYERIPNRPMGGTLPTLATSSRHLLEEKVRDLMQLMNMNEIITSSLVRNDAIETYEQEGTFPSVVLIQNAPDSSTATLRPTLLINLVELAQRASKARQDRIAFFEIGKTYSHTGKGQYEEQTRIGFIIGGKIDTRSWNKDPRSLTFYDVKGLVEGLLKSLGVEFRIAIESSHPSIDPVIQGTIYSGQGLSIGSLGQIHETIIRTMGLEQPLFVAELSLDEVLQAPKVMFAPFSVEPTFPPAVQDFAFIVPQDFRVGPFIEAIQQIDPLVSDVSLVDVYEQSRAFRVTFLHPSQTLSSEDIKPIREQIIRFAEDKLNLTLRA